MQAKPSKTHPALLTTSNIAVQAKPSMTKSSVVDNETGKSMDSTVRTSTGTFFARGQDEVLAAVEKRIAQVCTCNHHHHAAAVSVSVDFNMCDILSLSVEWCQLYHVAFCL